MKIKYRALTIFLVIVIVAVLASVIIFWIKFDLPRLIRLRRLSYLYELDKNYQFKKHAAVPSPFKIIVSLTTIPDRLPHLYPALSSILDQSVSVDAIHLNLPRISRKGKPYVAPDWLLKLKNVKLVWLDKDYGPASKLIPSLQSEFFTTRIVVMDDDNLYHYRTIERLIRDFEKRNKDCQTHPQYAVSTFGVKLNCHGRLPGFSDWDRVSLLIKPATRVDHLQGCFGFVVTPSMFPPQVFDQDAAPDCVKSVDDVWFSSWLALYDIEIWTLDYSFWIVPFHDWGDVNYTPRLFDGENKGFIPEHKTLEWFEQTQGYKCLRC